jgi:hypothetical protein
MRNTKPAPRGAPEHILKLSKLRHHALPTPDRQPILASWRWTKFRLGRVADNETGSASGRKVRLADPQVLTRPARVKPADQTFIIVLSNGDQEIERGMALSGDGALGLALMMLARRGRLRPGDMLRVLASEDWGRFEAALVRASFL